jgi:hypothetical protein
MPSPQRVVNPLLTARIIWGSLLLGDAAFLAVILLVIWPQQATSAPRPFADNPLLLFYMACAMLCISAVAGFFVRSMIFQRGRDDRGQIRAPAYVTGMIIFLAMLEGAAFFGLVNLMLSRTLWPHVLVPGIAMAIQLLSFPSNPDLAI